MRKVCLVLSILFSSICVFSQKKEVPISLNLYGGYTFQDRVDLGYYNNYNNYGYIRANGQYGAGLEFFVDPMRSLELSYQHMGTKAPFYDWEGQTNRNNEDASLDYILIGGNNYLDNGGKVVPYGGAGIGVGIANFHYEDNQGSTSVTKFAWNLHLGVKIRTGSAVSIKLQAYLQSIVEGVGVGVGFGTGGAGAGVTTYSTMLQFGLGGGLCFDLGHKGKK